MNHQKSLFDDELLLNKINNPNELISNKIKAIMDAQNVSLKELAKNTAIYDKLLSRILDDNVYPINVGRKATRLYDYLNITAALNVPKNLVVNMLGIPDYVDNTIEDISRFMGWMNTVQRVSKRTLVKELNTSIFSLQNLTKRTRTASIHLIVRVNHFLNPLMDHTEPLFFIQSKLFKLNMSRTEVITKYKISPSLLSYLSNNYKNKTSLKKYNELMKKLGYDDEHTFKSLGMNNISKDCTINEYGAKMKALAREKGVRAKDLADNLGTSLPEIYAIMNRSSVNIGTAVKMNYLLEHPQKLVLN